MGSTAAQGWYLLTFLVGFTLAPAGLVALGWLVALVGFALLVVSFAGFYSIKQPVSGSETTEAASGYGVRSATRSH